MAAADLYADAPRVTLADYAADIAYENAGAVPIALVCTECMEPCVEPVRAVEGESEDLEELIQEA